MIITSKSEYQKTLKRLDKGEKIINENGGFLDAPQKWTRGFQILAEACLIYEIQSGIFDEQFEAWLNNKKASEIEALLES